MKIALVVGHDKIKQGAVGSKGISEYAFWREFLHEFVNEYKLPSHIETKIFERNHSIHGYGSKMIELHERIDAWGANVSIEFHFNAASDPSISGHEVLYCINSTIGMVYASMLNSEFSELGNRDRGIKGRSLGERGGGFLCHGKSACLIAEPFFGSEQDRFLNGGDLREALAYSLIGFMDEARD